MWSHVKNNAAKILFVSGSLILLGALVFLIWNFWPDIALETGYQWQQLRQRINPSQAEVTNSYDHPLVKVTEISTTDITTDNNVLSALKQDLINTYAPVFPDYGIVIPKINANARIVEDVDPYNLDIYSKALSLGIAQAAGTAAPGTNGNTFLFAHSGRHFYEGINENVQFYLLDKLSEGDEILIFKAGNTYIYQVTATMRVWPEDTSYLTKQDYDYNLLTLMSCWPAGVNYQRQIVQAKLTAAF